MKRRSIPLIKGRAACGPRSPRGHAPPARDVRPALTAATSWGRSAGVLQVPVHRHDDVAARADEACVHGGCWPKLRFRRTARSWASPAWSRSSTAHVPSVEPSSTKMIS